ncbi:nicotinamidase-related amidase [Streptomyces sp. V4I23]|uniref:isochorismatase family protein n=1 Tax=Streptomyces sp. V4I23 TaxID=3042282 RepID=UPI002787EBDF|nr:isochorismatase family protein [Streptomyces sp. V4I23]MDQ1007196.1 nicotinamidase-related amidase [Streptomyces sp. V4I23]
MSTHLQPVEALLVVDVQSAFVSGTGAVPDAVRLVDRTTDLIARARRSGALVIHLQNDGPAGADDEPHTPGWELHHAVESGPTEAVVRKPQDDGFQATVLERLLTDAGVKSLAICGVMSEMCVQATARTALALGYRVVLPHDAHATHDIPAAPGISERIPAAVVSRVAEWALGSDLEITPHASHVAFQAVPASPVS